jgi:hypothetical protein
MPLTFETSCGRGNSSLLPSKIGGGGEIRYSSGNIEKESFLWKTINSKSYPWMFYIFYSGRNKGSSANVIRVTDWTISR